MTERDVDRSTRREKIDWQHVVYRSARRIVESYDTPVTLRQLFYRLVSLPHDDPARIPNTVSTYVTLSKVTAQWRRDGVFPELLDAGAAITLWRTYSSPQEAIRRLRRSYGRDHTQGQPYQLWLATEKEGMVAQLESWFSELGVPIIALGGQASEGLIGRVRAQVRRDGRPAILLYAGDHDPSGWRILSSFVDRTGWWANPELPDWDPADMPTDYGYPIKVKASGRRMGKAVRTTKNPTPNYDRYRKYRVALQPEQCDGLPRNAAKESDNNMDAFLANFAHTLTDDEVDAGLGVQIEMDAIEPNRLRGLYAEAIEQYWDDDAYQESLSQEAADLEVFDEIIESLEDDDDDD